MNTFLVMHEFWLGTSFQREVCRGLQEGEVIERPSLLDLLFHIIWQCGKWMPEIMSSLTGEYHYKVRHNWINQPRTLVQGINLYAARVV